MKPMATETKVDFGTISVQAPMEPKRPEELKEKRKRLRIIAISVVVLVVIVIAAIITAVCVAGKQAENNIKIAWLAYKETAGDTRTQKVSVTSREEKFEITGTGTAVFDFDTSLLVYRFEQMTNPTCYLTAFNTSMLISPEKFRELIGYKSTIDFSSIPAKSVQFTSTDIAIPNKDFLLPVSKEICTDTSLNWMLPKQASKGGHQNSEDENSVVKCLKYNLSFGDSFKTVTEGIINYSP